MRLSVRVLPARGWPRPRRQTVVAAGITLALAAVSLVGMLALRVDTQPRAFLPAGDTTLADLDAAARDFGGDPIVVLAESRDPGQLLGPEQLPLVLKLEGQLAKLPDVAVVYGPATVLNSIADSSKNILNEIFGSRDAATQEAQRQARESGASPDAVAAAGDAATAAFDERYAPLLVRGLPVGLPTLRNPAFVRNLIFDTDPQGGMRPRSQWRFVVPSVNAISVLVRPREQLDQESTDRLVAAVRTTVESAGLATQSLTITGAPVVAASMAEQVRREIPLLGGCAVGLISLCYLLVPWLGRRRDRLLPIAATLAATGLTMAVFGWSGRPLSLGAMAFLPILIGIGSDFPAYLMQRARRRQVVVAALASAAGFGSLTVSPLPFVRDLGLALAMGVLLAVLTALALRRWLVPGTGRDDAEQSAHSETAAPRALALPARIGLAGVAVALAAVGWVALPRLALEASPDQLASGMTAIADAQHAERVLGSSGELRVVLTGANVLAPEAIDWMRRAEDAVVLGHGDQARPIVSLPDLLRFLGPTPTPEQVAAAADLLPSYLLGAVTTPDGKSAVLSLGLGLQDLGSQQRLIDDLRGSLPPVPAGFQASVSGLPVVASRGYELISGSRYLPNLLGIAAAGLVLLLGLRRRSDAGRAVMAAVLATGWGLAAAAGLGISLSPLTIALGSLTTATACEFTVLLSDGLRARRAGRQRTVAVAALAAAIGYATLAVSSLHVIREFGLLLSMTVLLSLASAHLVVRVWPTRAPRSGDGCGDGTAPAAAPIRAMVAV